MYDYRDELYHHGILGQKWGKRNGPPYPLKGGDYSQSERKAIGKARLKKNSIYNKKHFDETVKQGTKFSTLSYDPNRTKNTDMYYAVHNNSDRHLYNAVFNRPLEREVFDENGKSLGRGNYLKYRIDNEALRDIKVASEDSGAEEFKKLFASNRDFYNFVMDPDRMQACFDPKRYRHKGYAEARDTLERIRGGQKPTSDDLSVIYRMYNYTIPNDGAGDARRARDVQTQRARFFNALSSDGYGAVLDTNDAIYNKLYATSPVIVFDQENVALSGVNLTTTNSKRFSTLMFVGRKALGG